MFLGRLSPWFLITIEIVIRGPNLFWIAAALLWGYLRFILEVGSSLFTEGLLGFCYPTPCRCTLPFGRLYFFLIGYLFTLIILQGTTCVDSCGASFRQVLLAEFCLWVMSLPIFPRGTALVVGFDVFLRISYHCT